MESIQRHFRPFLHSQWSSVLLGFIAELTVSKYFNKMNEESSVTKKIIKNGYNVNVKLSIQLLKICYPSILNSWVNVLL